MATYEELVAHSERVSLALSSADEKLDAVRALVVSLKEQVGTGGVVSQEQLDAVVSALGESAEKAEAVDAEVTEVLA